MGLTALVVHCSRARWEGKTSPAEQGAERGSFVYAYARLCWHGKLSSAALTCSFQDPPLCLSLHKLGRLSSTLAQTARHSIRLVNRRGMSSLAPSWASPLMSFYGMPCMCLQR